MEKRDDNENGGKYGKGVIAKTYTSGQEFETEIELTANHWGTFDFAVCPLNGPNDVETELADGSDKYELNTGSSGTFNIKLVLLQGLTCEQSSLRWNYRVSNSWGTCEDGSGDQETCCGDQETFRT